MHGFNYIPNFAIII
ncbi:CRISPR-associated DxTHG motif protein [Sulfurimonas marina]|uniref:CRISPR-associated DxTHG motif protein n=1 Tax=Sulfurimonas marina TaxID=2590551 RepID=A0A7M1AYF5_9BACT|nr:CRISPR-associated DxTHG motif protein [Sulfurimonas marina]